MKYIKFSDVANFSYGKIPNKKIITNNNKYPIWSGYLFSGYYPQKNTSSGDFIIVARGVGGTGDVKYVSEDCWLTNLSIRGQVKTKEVLSKYIVYKFSRNNLRFLDSGSAQSQITISDLNNLVLKIHPLIEQRHIVDTICYF